ncbi:MAG: sigma 54-interacting transcriptional regulator [Bryobacteraceae bacterium]
MTPSAASPSSILLNASVLVFLFRALVGARTPGRRAQVADQLLRLLEDFISFGSGRIIVGDDLETAFLRAAGELGGDAPSLWRHLTSEGPYEGDGLVAVPIYAGGALAGALLLRGAEPGAMATLSPVASLAALAIENAREVEHLRDERTVLEQRLCGHGGILGESPAIRSLLDRIEKLAPRDTTVLIQGESGTGKELVARLLHRGSPRADAPFVAINCAAIAETLLESELFGYEKGAFTGAATAKKGKIEAADKGTLFLDEIGELALPLQAKLLRVLQEREVERVGSTRAVKIDIRVVTATNRDLAEKVKNGSFRSDLYHRLNVVALRTPPLRTRKEDIPLLAAHFLTLFGERSKKLSPEALRCLQAYDWPGNVRELSNAIEHAVALGDTGPVVPADLPESIWDAAPYADVGAYQSTVSDAKRESILKAYQQAGGDYKGAAKLLGLNPTYLLRLVRNLGLREAVKK